MVDAVSRKVSSYLTTCKVVMRFRKKFEGRGNKHFQVGVNLTYYKNFGLKNYLLSLAEEHGKGEHRAAESHSMETPVQH